MSYSGDTRKDKGVARHAHQRMHSRPDAKASLQIDTHITQTVFYCGRTTPQHHNIDPRVRQHDVSGTRGVSSLTIYNIIRYG